MKHPRPVFIAFSVLLLTFAINLAGAASNPPVLPPAAHAYGKSYAEWSTAWLQWAHKIPASVNPLLDTTGAYAAYGQSGKVWFLGGTTETGKIITRNITVPSGTPLFFPIINYYWVNVPAAGDNPWSSAQEAFARDYIADVVDTATGLELKIDGRPVPNLDDFRFQSKVGKCQLPADNLFGIPAAAGSHECVTDGFWVLLPPLSVGSHTIHFKGGFPGTDPFSLDVTYKITVKPGRKVVMPLHR